MPRENSHTAAQELTIQLGKVALKGSLTAPRHARAVVVFAHGSGSGRHSPRNIRVARTLQQAGLATLLFDLLTVEEEIEDELRAHLRFDIEMLAERLVGVTDWLVRRPSINQSAVGYFGASTGAAAVLIAAARRAQKAGAVVSRGGRPDLAGPYLEQVCAPTLLIVGQRDEAVIDLNRDAMEGLRAEKRLEIVPNATHLFEEPGSLEHVAELARDWFRQHLGLTEPRGVRVA